MGRARPRRDARGCSWEAPQGADGRAPCPRSLCEDSGHPAACLSAQDLTSPGDGGGPGAEVGAGIPNHREGQGGVRADLSRPPPPCEVCRPRSQGLGTWNSGFISSPNLLRIPGPSSIQLSLELKENGFARLRVRHHPLWLPEDGPRRTVTGSPGHGRPALPRPRPQPQGGGTPDAALGLRVWSPPLPACDPEPLPSCPRACGTCGAFRGLPWPLASARSAPWLQPPDSLGHPRPRLTPRPHHPALRLPSCPPPPPRSGPTPGPGPPAPPTPVPGLYCWMVLYVCAHI